MEVMDVRGPEFKAYDRVTEGYDVSGPMKAMESTPLPEEVVYVASVPELEALFVAKELANGICGQMEIQVGYCDGHNRKLNVPEYHRDLEMNLVVKGLILPLGKQQNTPESFTYDTSEIRAFPVPTGTLIEVYATTLRYAPCEAGDEGSRCVVMLPQGTNMELGYRPVDRCREEKSLATRNKWLIGHEEGSLDKGA